MRCSDSRHVRTNTRFVRFGLWLALFGLCALILMPQQAIMTSAVALDPTFDVDVDSKQLVVHGPFHYPPPGTSAGTQQPGTLLQRIDRGGQRDDDYDVNRPGADCPVPANCAGRTPAHPHILPDSPPTRTTWTWDQSIGAGDPQIAAGPNSLVVTSYEHFAYLNKHDGLFLPVKRPATPVINGGRNVGPASPIGNLPRTGTFFTGDLFAPMVDDINAHLNLTPAQKAACTAKHFDCNINTFYDTRVIYDEYRSRFWLVSLGISKVITADPDLQPARRGKLAVAVSVTSDPRDGWNLYWWDSIPNDGHWPQSESGAEHAADYPTVGISPKYLLEEHNAGRMDDLSKTVTIVEADPLSLGENPTQLKALQFWHFKDPNGGIVKSTIQPAVHHGNVPSRFAAVFASTFNDGDQSILSLYFFNDTHDRFSRADVPIDRFFAPQDAPQPATPQIPHPFKFQLTNTGCQVMKAAFANGRVFATFNDCHSFPGSHGCVTSVRLVRIRIGDPNVLEVDQAIGDRFSNEPSSIGHVFFGMPAIEVNSGGDAALIYMRSGAHVFPEAAYSVLFHDADVISTGLVLHAGNNSHTGQGEPIRDLDTAGISVDPVNDSIWIADGYMDGGGFRIAVGQILGRRAVGQPNKKN